MINNYDEHFTDEFNSYYPFEKYMVEKPEGIDNLFDDMLLTEIFIPSTEIKPILSTDGKFTGEFTKINSDEIYVKLKTPDGCEVRMGYYDFEENIRENIRQIIIQDIGPYEWECLYVEHEDTKDIEEKLLLQKKRIIEKYGECKVKNNSRFVEKLSL